MTPLLVLLVALILCASNVLAQIDGTTSTSTSSVAPVTLAPPVVVIGSQSADQSDGFSQRDAFLLAFFVGPWGAHRFYLELWLSAGFQLALTILFCVVNVLVRCCWTRDDEEKAVLKSLIICTFGCAVAAWWIIDWALIAAGVLTPATADYTYYFN